MTIYSVNMIDATDLRDAINIQYDCNASCMDIALALGKDSWVEGAHEIYFGPDRGLTLDLENCIITYLRDILPSEESVFINFSA